MSESERESIPQQLRAARRTKGVELEDVYRSIGVSLPVLQGIEAGNYDVIEPVFSRMAFGAYIDYLGLDKEALLARFDSEQGPPLHPVQAVELSSSPALPTPEAGLPFDMGVVRMIGLAAGALVALIIVISLLDGDEASTVRESSTRQAVDVPIAKRSEPAVVERSQTSTPPPVVADPMPAIPEKIEEIAADNMEPERRELNTDGAVAARREEPGDAVLIAEAEGEAAVIRRPRDATTNGDSPRDEVTLRPNDEVPIAASVNDARAEDFEPVIDAQSASNGTSVEEPELAAAAVVEAGTTDVDGVVVAPAAIEDGLLLLEVEAVDSTWVQVNWDRSGYFQGIVPRGETRRWQAKDFFRVHSGRAHGLRYTFQGQLLGDGLFGEATKVLRFSATSESVNLLGADLKPLETAAQP
ncbi:MAG: cytoskeletal protein RodZ [Candidatus Latescibacterota bacterium]|jgi:cytoskeletal protein RodZ